MPAPPLHEMSDQGALFLVQMGNTDLALKFFEKALSLDGKHVRDIDTSFLTYFSRACSITLCAAFTGGLDAFTIPCRLDAAQKGRA